LEFCISLVLRANPEELKNYKFAIFKLLEFDYSKNIGIWGEAFCTSKELCDGKDSKIQLKFKERDPEAASSGGHLILSPIDV